MAFRNLFLQSKEFFKDLKKNPLKLISAAGIVIALILAWILLFYSLTRNLSIYPEKASQSFHAELEKYDASLTETPQSLNQLLLNLEKKARTQEEWLSVLKRRRNLARLDTEFLPAYQKSCGEAVKQYPYSEIMAVMAAESLTQGEIRPDLVKNYAARITQPVLFPLALGLHALTGNLETPGLAIKIPGIRELLGTEVSSALRGSLLIDEFLLDIISGETREAAIRINNLLRTSPESRELLRLGGEYFYDYGNPFRAAELFSRLGGDGYMGRSAEALALAKELPGARNIWTALTSGPASDKDGLRERSLYNLAATAADKKEAASWLEKLFSAPQKTGEEAGLYAVISYTRLQDTSRSIAILEEANPKDHPILDLELLRRCLDTWPVDRSTAEVWLLLGRHPGAEALYQWAAWYFDRQKLHEETAQLIKIALQRQMDAPWLRICRSLALIREGNIGEGLKILEAENLSGDWRTFANIARIQEGYRSVSAALENYQNAATLADNPRDLSLIQLRISRCLEALARFDESQKALENALELDPENFNARMELWRMSK